jgi:reverse gyrase
MTLYEVSLPLFMVLVLLFIKLITMFEFSPLPSGGKKAKKRSLFDRMIDAGLVDDPMGNAVELLSERLRFETWISWELVRSIMGKFDGDFKQAKAYVEKMQQDMVNLLTMQSGLEPEIATTLLVHSQWNYGKAEIKALNWKNKMEKRSLFGIMIDAGLVDDPMGDMTELFNERLRFETGISWDYVRPVMDQFDGDFDLAESYVEKMQEEMVNRLIEQFGMEPEFATALLVFYQWNYGDAETRAFNSI